MKEDKRFDVNIEMFGDMDYIMEAVEIISTTLSSSLLKRVALSIKYVGDEDENA